MRPASSRFTGIGKTGTAAARQESLSKAGLLREPGRFEFSLQTPDLIGEYNPDAKEDYDSAIKRIRQLAEEENSRLAVVPARPS